MDVQAPSSQTTLLILLGASTWPFSPEFQDSEAFANAARRVKAYFLHPQPFGLPAENLLDLFDADNSADELDMAIGQFLEQRLAAMKAAGKAGRDLLLYFIGHGGFIGQDADFYLAIRRTRMGSPRASSMQMMSLADTLTERARHLRRILILDCCFAAAAFSAFQAGPDQVALQKTNDAFEVRQKAVGFPTKGTTLLCSSGHKSPSLLLPDGSSTTFTKAFLDALVQGTPSLRDHLSLRDVKDITADLLYGIRNAPRPVVLSPDQSEGDVADIPFFPNPRFEEQRLRKAEEERRRRTEEEQARQAEAEQLHRAREEHSRQAEERPVREAEPDRASLHVSASPLGTTEVAAVFSGRPIKQYLFALLVGAFAGIFSVFLTTVIFSVNHDNYVLLPLPPLVMSLITGFIIGKRVVVRTAGLFAGLVVGVSWSVYILSVRVNNPIMDPKEWVTESVTVVACAATCGLLTWLVAWLTIGTTEATTALQGRPRERHLFTLLVGALAGIFSVFLTGVIYSVLKDVNFRFDEHVGFALLPPLVMSLIAGFLTGKYVVVRTAGLFAGLVVGVSWFVYTLYMMLAHDAGFTPYFQQEWITIVACAATCGPLSWLVAWLTTRTHSYYLSSGSRTEGR